MKKILKWFGLGLLLLVSTLALFVFSARFQDGPLEIIAGGPFTSGSPATAPSDWSFLKDRATIEFQTLEPARSRVVWLAVNDGKLFIVSGYMTSNYGAIWKQWPHYLDDDDRIILRIDGNLYEQRLQRIMDGPDVMPVLKEFNRKYGAGEPTSIATITDGETWMYQVVPR